MSELASSEKGPSTARDEVLARIRTARGDAPVPPVGRDYRTSDDRSPAELLDVLVNRLEDYKATVLRCGPGDVAATVAGALAVLDGSVVVAPGLPADWRPDGVVEDDGRPAVALAEHAATVTGVATAIAETGTLVLDGSPLSGRRALSLLPDCLVCDS